MIVAPLVLLLPLAWGSVAASSTAFQSPRDGDCTEWHDCRQQALAAADRGEYETFHDLAWRAVQTGPPKDPALMYLLARAQSLSGRPHDALIMLERLAQMGVASDAATNEDFSRTRQLPDWPEAEALIERIAHPSAVPAAATASSPPSPPDRVDRRPPIAPTLVTEAVRFSTARFAVGGLAYDAASHRFLFGDRLGRKLIVVGEGSNHAVDLVRADSAGFHDISAIEIDQRRGDLWVASAAAADGAGMLHRLQLVSGRLLRAFRVAADLEPVRLVDLAVTPTGAVLVLDAASRQLFVLRSGATSLERVMRIDVQEPASLAIGGDDQVAYVAHRDGLSRIDLRGRTTSPIAAPDGISLMHLERIRWQGHALVAVRVDGDNSRRIIRLELNAGGRAVTRATTLEASIPAAGPTFITVSGDELLYVVDGSNDAVGRLSPAASSDLAEFVAYRIPLR
jgi:hypothetical protein